MRPIEEQGYVCVAVNTDTFDYVSMARRLFASLRHWNPEARTCLITDTETAAEEFDHVRILLPQDNPYANDSQAFRLSPFRETIKLEADMLIVSPIDHWWSMCRHKDVLISTGCRDWRDAPTTIRDYRKCFDANNLPDVYNAVTYWRLSALAKQFFDNVKLVFQNWSAISRELTYSEGEPSTDLVYAIVAQLMGPNTITMPFVSYPQIVHMRPKIASTSGAWHRELVWEWNHVLRVNTIPQWGAFHYHEKDWQP